jgi:hypothetical protein
MPSLEESAANKLATALADQRMSPAILAMKISRENVHVNEAMLGMFTNYIVIMANKQLVPFHMVEHQRMCKQIYLSLQELGLTGQVQQDTANEYVVV